MKIRCLVAVVLLFGMCTRLRADESIANVAPGFSLRTVTTGKWFNSFTWDENGVLWTLHTRGRQLVVEKTGESSMSHSIRRRGDHPAGLLVGGGRVYVSDGNAIRVFRVDERQWSEITSLVPPRDVFPANTSLSSMRWGPLGDVHVSLSNGSGIGRVDVRGASWDMVAGGMNGSEFSFDAEGFMMASDALSGHVFRVAPGLDYTRGLESYSPVDLAKRLDREGLKVSGLTVYSGDQWPTENDATWLVILPSQNDCDVRRAAAKQDTECRRPDSSFMRTTMASWWCRLARSRACWRPPASTPQREVPELHFRGLPFHGPIRGTSGTGIQRGRRAFRGYRE